MAPTIQLLFIDGCPLTAPALRIVRAVAARLAPGAVVGTIRVENDEQAGALRFAGSPTILVDGRDIEDDAPVIAGLACRRYEGPDGLPPAWRVEAAILRALRRRHSLFL